MPRERECEYPDHAPECPCLTCKRDSCSGCNVPTRDHFTPKCIADVWGWSGEQKGADKNIQWLSRACHIKKDRTTPLRRDMLREQKNGKKIGFGEHHKRINNFLNNGSRG